MNMDTNISLSADADITKGESKMLKGVAILAMLMLHLYKSGVSEVI